MIVDANGIRHQTGCEWMCGIHDPEQYWCGCAQPQPKRGAKHLCVKCGARIPQDSDLHDHEET